MAQLSTVQYLNVPERVSVRSRRSSLPAIKLRKVLAVKALHNYGLRPNKSQGDLAGVNLSANLGKTRKHEETNLSANRLPVSRKQSKSSTNLTDKCNYNGNQFVGSSPLITITIPTPDNKMKKANTTSQLPGTAEGSMTTNTVSLAQAGPSSLIAEIPDVKVSRGSSMRLKEQHSPLVTRRSLGGENSSSDTTPRLKQIHTTEGALNYYHASHEAQSNLSSAIVDDDESGEGNGFEVGSGGSDITEDVVDGNSADIDPQRTAAIKQLKEKVHKTMEQIKNEQKTKEENVNEYLRLSSNADKAQAARIKTLFEKRNIKSAQNIIQLQSKLNNYKKRLKEVEAHGVTGPRKAKEVMKDMSQGLKVLFTRETRSRDTSPSRPRDVGANIRDGISGFSGGVVDNIRGAKDSIVSKPKEFVHLVKNRFGSADNINSLKNLEDTQGSTDDNTDKHSYLGGGGGTLPSGYQFTISGNSEDGDEVISVVSSESHRSGGLHSGVHSNSHSVPPHQSITSNEDVTHILHELSFQRKAHERLSEEISLLRNQSSIEHDSVKQLLDEERYRLERLEEQVNDLLELHQHEVTNIKQELQSMEEKMEYQLEERTRDMQELLESCQTRITKMELQQQQQQLISMEGFDNSNFRNLITKLINVVLAILAVLLVLVATIAQFLGPFLTTRVRILSTIFLVALSILVWQNWNHMTEIPHKFVDFFINLLPAR